MHRIFAQSKRNHFRLYSITRKESNDDIFKLSTQPPYHLSLSTVNSLKLTAQVSQSLVSSNYRNIILSAPHAGSTKMIEKIGEALAVDIGSSILTVDFQSVLKYLQFDTSRPHLRKCNLRAHLVSLDGPSPTKSFSPSFYHIEEDGYDDDGELDKEEDKDEEERDEERAVALPYSSTFIKKKSPKFVLNFNLMMDKEQTKTGDTSFSVVSLSVPQSTPSVSTEPHVVEKPQTPYDTVLSDLEINTYLNGLYDSINTRFKKGDYKKMIILVRDTTDMLESTKKETGRRLFHGLRDLVDQLRTEVHIPTVLVASCSPSLMDSANLSQDLDYYMQMIDGSLPNLTKSGEAVSIAADGTLFETSLDNMLDKFDKILLLPPAPIYQYLRDGDKKSSRRTKREEEGRLGGYLLGLERELAVRVGEINAMFIEGVCGGRGVEGGGRIEELIREATVRTTTVELLAGTKTSSKPHVFTQLTSRIWTTAEVERLLVLAVGARMESLSLVEPDFTTIDGRDFEDGLKIMYETDIRRCPPIDLDSDGVYGDVGGGVERDLDVSGKDGVWGGSELEGKDLKDDSKRGGSHLDLDRVANDLKRRGIKLNSYEKRILSTVVNPMNIKTEFKDLVLPASTKLVLQTLVTLPLLKPEFFEKGILSKSSINGVLLFGPPGTGKTMLAKAVAKSSGAWFMNVSLSTIFEKYVGEGEKNVRAIFSLARKLGGSCIIFLDEVDALFGSRKSESGSGGRREIMNEFMSEWDGLVSNNHGVVVLGATNRPFDLDDAILRRMPRRILIDLPNEEARTKILESHLDGETLEPGVSLTEIAKKTQHYSGSDLKNVCVSSALARIKETIMLEQTPSTTKLDFDTLKSKMESIDDWSVYLGKSGNGRSQPPATLSSALKLKPLNETHIELGLSECPPSLSDEMETLVELRKWNGRYGDGSSRKSAKLKGIGFDI